ncbi:unnamed protein product [Cylicocyclus nassatus]|uniref:SGNH domain-containing protein n=1 Tax=Cylicocyclus nassatus TaxID=53992 RepID=A0AA36M2I2_CYLNA|nr:unnamed protein product [Cylicocyclus nassatus]
MLLTSNATKYMDMEGRWVQQLFTPKCNNSQAAIVNCDLPFFKTKVTTDQAIRINKLFSYDDERNLIIPSCTYDKPPGPWEWCHFPSSNSTVKQKLLILGNSYAANQGKVIYDACARNNIDAAVYTKPVCESLVDHKEKWACKGLHKDFSKAVADYKPDILFLLFRHLTWMDTPKTAIPDPLVENAVPILRNLEEHVNLHVFVLNALPRPRNGYQETYHAILRANKSMDQSLLYNTTTHYEAARWRIEQLAKNCQKCSVIDYTPLFTFNGTFNFVDERTKVAYMNDAKHFTPLGLYYLQKLYKDMCDKIDW